MEAAITSLLAETDPDLARSGMESELKLLEGLLTMRPDDRELLEMAIMGFTGYALMFLEDEYPQRAQKIYRRALNYGFRAFSKIDKRFCSDELTYGEWVKLIGLLKSEDIHVVYWSALAWSGQINLDRTSPQSLVEAPRATALMQWVFDREPHFYYSGPLWYFGTYYTTLPPPMGGDTNKAKEYYNRAINKDGEDLRLINRVAARKAALLLEKVDEFF